MNIKRLVVALNIALFSALGIIGSTFSSAYASGSLSTQKSTIYSTMGWNRYGSPVYYRPDGSHYTPVYACYRWRYDNKNKYWFLVDGREHIYPPVLSDKPLYPPYYPPSRSDDIFSDGIKSMCA